MPFGGMSTWDPTDCSKLCLLERVTNAFRRDVHLGLSHGQRRPRVSRKVTNAFRRDVHLGLCQGAAY